MKKRAIIFLKALIVWMLLNLAFEWQHLLVGIVVAALVAYLTGDLLISRPGLLAHPHRYFYFFFHFMPLLIWEIIKASLDAAYRIIHPGLPVKPGIVKVRTTLKSDTALTLLANAITLRPGTMTVDIDRENGIIYVHWLDVRSGDIEENTRLIVKRYENVLTKIID